MSRCFVWRHWIQHFWQILLLAEGNYGAPIGWEQLRVFIQWRIWLFKEMLHSTSISEDHNKGCVQLSEYLFHLFSIIVSSSWFCFPDSSDQSIFMIKWLLSILVCLPIQITRETIADNCMFFFFLIFFFFSSNRPSVEKKREKEWNTCS